MSMAKKRKKRGKARLPHLEYPMGCSAAPRSHRTPTQFESRESWAPITPHSVRSSQKQTKIRSRPQLMLTDFSSSH